MANSINIYINQTFIYFSKQTYFPIMATELSNYTASRYIPVEDLTVTPTRAQFRVIPVRQKVPIKLLAEFRRKKT